MDHAQSCQLNLSGCSITYKFLENLKNSPLCQIRKLDLTSSQISPSIMNALFGCPEIKLPKLQHLLLSFLFNDQDYNMVGPEGFKYLIGQIRPGGSLKNQKNKTAAIPNLRKLELSFGGIGDQGISYLNQEGDNNAPFAIQSLNLICNRLSASSARILSFNSRLDHLKQLNLGGNPIGHKGAKYLVKSNWPKLEYLQLTGTLMTNQSFVLFTKYSFWPQLKSLLFTRDIMGICKLNQIAITYWSKLCYFSFQGRPLAQKLKTTYQSIFIQIKLIL